MFYSVSTAQWQCPLLFLIGQKEWKVHIFTLKDLYQLQPELC